jgi:N-acyl-D-amino-acid deacylase
LIRRLAPLIALALGVPRAAGPDAFPAEAFLLRGGAVADGSGAALRMADVRVRGGRIDEVGADLFARPGERVVDVRGLVVAPGFIDLHSHVDRQIFSVPADSQVAQGITTAVVGMDGGGPYPVGAFLARAAAEPSALNVATLVGHGAIRRAVMGGARRTASADEVAAMAERARRAMAAGAFGVSSGLAYEPGAFASAGETAALAAEARDAGGFYATHVRDEGDAALDALAEAMDVARATGAHVHVSHVKLASAATRGRAAAALALLRANPRVTADWYPYAYWVSTTAELSPARRPATAEDWRRVLADAGGPERMTVTAFTPDRSYVGRTVGELARARGVAPEDVLLDLARRGHAGIAAEAMDEGDLEDFLESPLVMIGSDGGIRVAHPRGAGTFPRVLGRYVRERRVIPLETAIRKMTEMPARLLGLDDRGRVEAGAWADLVVFDPETVADRATALRPDLPPVGIAHVFVNGVAVVTDGKVTGARPGRALRKK